jgi:methylenetetrahydrofolate reductase (NADPH)
MVYEDGLQLEMNFDPTVNRFHENLDQGNFILLFEQQAPSDTTDPLIAGERLKEFEYAVLGIKGIPAGLAITDRFASPNTLNAPDIAMTLDTDNRDRHLVYLSGRESSLQEAAESANLCIANGFPNVVAVSGSTYQEEVPRENRRRFFSDSVHLLELLKPREEKPFFAGCTVNPFKYTPETAFPQYFKLIKKLNQGANFVVVQVGWDIMKLQELRWYLSYRGCHFPTIARLMLLSPELLEKIQRGSLAGVNFSANFQAILESELKYSHNQFEAAQWRRLELQAAGCLLLGYSGVQLVGMNSPDKVKIAAERIKKALTEFTSFKEWAQEYLEYTAKTEMAPYPYKFYLFENLFSKAHLETAPVMTRVPPVNLANREKILYKLRKFMFPRADKQIPGSHYIAKKLFASCKECAQCRLPKTFYICPEICPKGMANGPCGGSSVEGICESSDMQCIYNEIMHLATWCGKVHKLEENLIPPVERNL